MLLALALVAFGVGVASDIGAIAERCYGACTEAPSGGTSATASRDGE